MLKALVVVVAVSGCGVQPFPGAPVAGAKCNATRPECVTPGEISYCEGGKWVEYACPSECRNLQGQRCDWLTQKAGDACVSEGVSTCAEDGTHLVQCSSGKIVFTACPSSCVGFFGIHEACNP